MDYSNTKLQDHGPAGQSTTSSCQSFLPMGERIQAALTLARHHCCHLLPHHRCRSLPTTVVLPHMQYHNYLRLRFTIMLPPGSLKCSDAPELMTAQSLNALSTSITTLTGILARTGIHAHQCPRFSTSQQEVVFQGEERVEETPRPEYQEQKAGRCSPAYDVVMIPPCFCTVSLSIKYSFCK